jgi:hypothetical protein
MWGVDIVIDFIDRVSSGKKIIKYENGTTETVTIENAEDATVEGTPLNRKNMMAVQGFDNINVDIDEDENGNITVTEINGDNHTLTVNIIKNEDGTVTVVETFVGEKNITRTSTINADGTQISGVVK